MNKIKRKEKEAELLDFVTLARHGHHNPKKLKTYSKFSPDSHITQGFSLTNYTSLVKGK